MKRYFQLGFITLLVLVGTASVRADDGSLVPVAVTHGEGASGAVLPPANEQAVLHVTSDAWNGMADLKFVIDDDFRVTAIRFYTWLDGVSNQSQYSIDELKRGVVLLNEGKFEIVKITSPSDFDPSSGGTIDLNYLHNPVSHKHFIMEAVRNGHQWVLETDDQSGRRAFTMMKMVGNFIFGKLIGIDKIQVN